jgi:hypothetical protein
MTGEPSLTQNFFSQVKNLAYALWQSSPNTVELVLADPVETVCASLSAALDASEEFHGKVVNQGFKIWRSRNYAQSRNTFAPILYGVISPYTEGSRIDAHFQLNPVMRLFLIVWFIGTTALALLSLIGGLLRATPESSALDAFPYLLPATLPLIGWAVLRWQQRRGRADEERIKLWVTDVSRQRNGQPARNK